VRDAEQATEEGSLRRAHRAVARAYAAAAAVALATGLAAPVGHPLAVAFAADVAATLAIFAFSAAYRNSSFYDAYWSVAPLPIALYWTAVSQGAVGARQALVLLLVAAWGARLTGNWLRGWRGLDHEDWRYVEIQRRTGRAYWLVSLVGIHAMPTLWVFGGLLPVYASLCVPARPLGALDSLAAAATAAAIGLEAAADAQLHGYRAARPPPGEFLRSGLWAWSRHPNYLGEMGFWWGLWLFGLAAAPGLWWTLAGPLGITLMFRFVSLPMIEARMRERRPGWAEWAARSSLVLPRPPRPV
jgi:steroid 5-alpha reductase family enzyme